MDYHSDSSKHRLAVLAQAVTLDLRKTAAAYEDGQTDTTGLPASAFADPIGRAYPVHTKEAALLSSAYFFADDPEGRANPETALALEKAASFWGIEEEFRSICSDLSEKRQHPKYALDLELDGAVLRHFPWHDRQSLEKTAQDFVNNRENLPRQARLKTAQNLLAARAAEQAQFEPEVSQAIDRCCGFGLLDHEKAAEALLERSHLLRKQSEHQPLIRKLAQVLQLLDDQPDTLKIAVDAFSAFDEETGLARRYGRGLALPEDQLAGPLLDKLAADQAGTVRLANGQTVRLADIDWSKVAEIDPALAEAVGGSTEKAAEVLPTWPRPDADLLIDMLGLQTV